MISKTYQKNQQQNALYFTLRKELQFVLLLFLSFQINGQQRATSGKAEKTVSMEAIIARASKNSLEAFKAKRQQNADMWQFRAYKAGLLPRMDLEFQPISYNRAVEKRYDSQNNIEVYRQTQVLNSFANVAITQNIQATGASLYLNSNFNSLTNYGDAVLRNYNVTPFRIGIYQPLMAFNRFKWEKKTAPLNYDLSRQNYIYEIENITIRSVELFFNWALASKRVDIALESTLSSEKLFAIGQKRYELGAIEKDDLLNLELDLYNARTNLTEVKKGLNEALSNLNLFLRDDKLTKDTMELPVLISNLYIKEEEALALALENNPVQISLKLRKIEALRDMDKIVKDNRFDLSMRASYGLNQNANTLQEAYAGFLDQQIVSVQLNMPLLDWGERKGKIKTARINKEVKDIELQQEEEQFRQKINLKVAEFNLQEQLVTGALKSSEIARTSYEISEKRFLSGTIDLLRLSNAKESWQAASENYIRSLSDYWKYYYEVQQLTLYDFINKKPVSKKLEDSNEN